jgi:hypothetical protein
MIQANADLAVSTARERMGIDLTFDRAGVEWLDGHLNRLRGHLSPSAQAGVVNVMGSFLGECMVRMHRGVWVEKPGSGWVVEVRRRYQVAANVFSKVEKQLAGAEGESVLSLFEITPLVAETGTTTGT